LGHFLNKIKNRRKKGVFWGLEVLKKKKRFPGSFRGHGEEKILDPIKTSLF
jgi:hypothetical protein